MGTIGSGGGAPMPLGTSLTRSVFWSGIHCIVVVEHRVEAGAGYAVDFAGLGVADPEFDRFGGDVGEGEPLSVGGPDGIAGAGARGKRDMNLRAIGDVHQLEGAGAGRDAVAAGSVVLAVILGLDAHAGETQERRRHARNRRVFLPGHQQNRVVRRAHQGNGAARRPSYSLAGLNPRNLPDQVLPGRAFRADSGREIQIAVLAAGATGPEQLAAVRELAQRRRADTAATGAKPLPEPIARCRRWYLCRPFRPEADRRRRLPSVPPSASVATVWNRWSSISSLIEPGYIVAGPRGSGRSNSLVTMARSLSTVGFTGGTRSSHCRHRSQISGTPASRCSTGAPRRQNALDAALARIGGSAAILVDDASTFSTLLCQEPWKHCSAGRETPGGDGLGGRHNRAERRIVPGPG